MLDTEAIEALLVGIGFIFAAVGTNNAHFGIFDQLHGFLITDGTLNAVEQRGQFEVEQIIVDRRHLLTLLVGLLAMRIVERTVGGEETALQHIVVIVRVVDDTHFVVGGVDGHAQVFGGRPFAAHFFGAEEVQTTDARKAIGGEVDS